MDHNNPPKAKPAPDPNDWRSHLEADSRGRIVNKIMETLKRHLPFNGQEGLNELRKIAVRFEEKFYAAATSRSDYLRKISLKMLTMETKSQTNNASSLPTNSGGNRLFLSKLVSQQGRQQVVSQQASQQQSPYPQQHLYQQIKQRIQQQYLLQTRQQVVSQQASQQQSPNPQQYLYQQMMKQQLQQQNLFQTNQLQPSQQFGMQTSSSGMIQSATPSNLQQNQQSVLRKPQPNAGIHQLQPSMVGSQSNGANMQRNQLRQQANNASSLPTNSSSQPSDPGEVID